MRGKKIVFAILALMLVSLFVTSIPSYAIEISNNYRRGATEPDAVVDPATGKTVGSIVDGEIPPGGRGADIGFVTAEEHRAINDFLEETRARDPEFTVEERQGRQGELIKIQNVPGLYKPSENRPARGHYSLRGELKTVDRKQVNDVYALVNVVYIYVDKDSYDGDLVNHEVAEYEELARFAKTTYDPENSRSLLDVKTELAGWLDNPDNKIEATRLLQAADATVTKETGVAIAPVEELIRDTVSDTSRTRFGVRGAVAASEFIHQIFYDMPQESLDAMNSSAQDITPEVTEVFNQVFAIDGSKIEGNEDNFKQYLANKKANEAVVAVFKSQDDLNRIAGGFEERTKLNFKELVHVRVLGQGDLRGIEEDILTRMFSSNLAVGDFSEVKLGAALEEHKIVAVAIGKGV